MDKPNGGITGSWEYSLKTPRGEMKVDLVIELREGKYNIVLFQDAIGQLKTISASYKDGELTASFRFFWMTTTLKARFDGDGFSGTQEFPEGTLEIKGNRGDFLERYEQIKKEIRNLNSRSTAPINDAETGNRVDALLAKMSLEEKIGQLWQIHGSGAPTGPGEPPASPFELVKKGMIGSLLGTWHPLTIYKFQKTAVQESRLGIPLLFMSDVIHGYKNNSPIPLALACSWDPTLIEETARMIAYECAVTGINVNFAPMIDLTRDPRWGRVMEGPGEDPYLASLIAESYIKGFQKKRLADDYAIAGCIKHFAGYGAVEGGRDYNTVDISERSLRDTYLPPFKRAIEAGAAMVMPSFTVYDGIPAVINTFLLDKVLRKEWGFEGVVITDHNALAESIKHGVSESLPDAAVRAFRAGIDIEMGSPAFAWHLKALMADKKVNEEDLNRAVKRILTLKMKLGLFENPYHRMNMDEFENLTVNQKQRAVCRKAAAHSMVLLKNEPCEGQPVLPLKKQGQKIALIGPYGESKSILGEWSSIGDETFAVPVAKGILDKIGSRENLRVCRGCHITRHEEGRMEEAVTAAKWADIVVLALGEASHFSGEAKCRVHLGLPEVQMELAREVVKSGKPFILLLFNGRPLALEWFDKNVQAIVEAWFPGTEGGNAIADILFGDTVPSGKLPISFPYTAGQIPVYYNHLSTGRAEKADGTNPYYSSRYLDCPTGPLYPFGHGLSYTTFEYSGFSLSKKRIKPGENLEIEVTVKNTGNCRGEETVQLYIQDVFGSVSRPVKELKGFEKIMLEPGQSGNVNFSISEKDLSFHTADMSFKAEPGLFNAMVGTSSRDISFTDQFELL
ncbi:MAG: beta-glucosidase BglX [Spirochaetales bacterium]|nr:beta-glucosidase BglX [Spirochaetales bacterium]